MTKFKPRQRVNVLVPKTDYNEPDKYLTGCVNACGTTCTLADRTIVPIEDEFGNLLNEVQEAGYLRRAFSYLLKTGIFILFLFPFTLNAQHQMRMGIFEGDTLLQDFTVVIDLPAFYVKTGDDLVFMDVVREYTSNPQEIVQGQQVVYTNYFFDGTYIKGTWVIGQGDYKLTNLEFIEEKSTIWELRLLPPLNILYQNQIR